MIFTSLFNYDICSYEYKTNKRRHLSHRAPFDRDILHRWTNILFKPCLQTHITQCFKCLAVHTYLIIMSGHLSIRLIKGGLIVQLLIETFFIDRLIYYLGHVMILTVSLFYIVAIYLICVGCIDFYCNSLTDSGFNFMMVRTEAGPSICFY